MRIRLDQALEDYYAWYKADFKSPGTLASKKSMLRRLLVSAGKSIYVDELGDEQINNYIELMSQTRDPGSMGQVSVALKGFCDWADERHYFGKKHNPMKRRKTPSQGRKRHRFLAAQDYPRLLQAAQHPRDRAVYALGWNLMLRASEMTPIRVGEYDRKRSRMIIHVLKKRERHDDEMIVGPELGEELDAWLRFYTNHLQARGHRLEPGMHLVPAKVRPTTWVREGGRFATKVVTDDDRLRPEAPISELEKLIRRGLLAIGWPELDPITGKKIRIGEHDLRRSGARALYEDLIRRGIPNAIQIVQAQLHHETEKQTRGYIEIDVDKEYRDQVLSEYRMYDEPSVNVTDLGEARALRESQGSSV